LGTGGMASVLAATVAGRWFVHRRGLVLGALTAAGATGQLIFLPFLGWLAQNRCWRSAAITVGIAALAVVPIVAFFLRNRPADLGLRAYGATVPAPGALSTCNPSRHASRGLTIGVRSRDFWLLSGSFFICGASTNGLIGTHLIPASMDHGMAEVTAASLLAVIGIFDVVGTLVSGVLTDRFDSRWLLFWYYGLRGLSLLFLPYAFGTAYFGLVLFIVFYGLDWVATVPPTVQLARKLFGQQNFTIVYGWIFAAHQLGAASIAFAAGPVRPFPGCSARRSARVDLVDVLGDGDSGRQGNQGLQPERPTGRRAGSRRGSPAHRADQLDGNRNLRRDLAGTGRGHPPIARGIQFRCRATECQSLSGPSFRWRDRDGHAAWVRASSAGSLDPLPGFRPDVRDHRVSGCIQT